MNSVKDMPSPSPLKRFFTESFAIMELTVMHLPMSRMKSRNENLHPVVVVDHGRRFGASESKSRSFDNCALMASLVVAQRGFVEQVALLDGPRGRRSCPCAPP